MRKRTLIVAALLGAAMLLGQACLCLGAWCPSYKCFSRCSNVCACVSDGYGGGNCVSIQAVPGLLEQGYRELQ